MSIFARLINFFQKYFVAVKTGEVKVNCYWRMCNKWLHLLTMLLPGPDLHFAGPTGTLEISQRLPAKYRWRPKKVTIWARGPWHSCHTVNLVLAYCITFIKRFDDRPKIATFRIKTPNFTRDIYLIWLAKTELRGARASWINQIKSFIILAVCRRSV